MDVLLGMILAVMGIMMLSIFKITKWTPDMLLSRFCKDVKIILTGVVISLSLVSVVLGFLIIDQLIK